VEELRFQVILDPELGGDVRGVLAFGDFQSDDPSTAIYKQTAVQEFYVDLILGRPFPFVFVARTLNLGTLLAIAIFMHRDLAIRPEVPGLIAAVSLTDHFGVAGLAHVDRDLARFLKFLGGYVGAAHGKKARQETLAQAVGWIRDYILRGELPGLPAEREPPRILDRGTDGFVMATCPHTDLVLGWEELFRAGFLRGVLYCQAGTDRWKVLGARKSDFLAFDLVRAAEMLNEAEAVMGEPRGWTSDGYWLSGPEDGTMLIPSAILQVLLRV
jgi:hypothetical protein